MKQIIIIGNGFDLAHGLKTSYTHFADFYLRNVFEKFISESKYSDNIIEINCTESLSVNTISEIKNRLKKKFEDGDLEKYKEVIQYLKSLDPTIKISFITDLSNQLFNENLIKNRKWWNIELEYFLELKKILENNNKISEEQTEKKIDILNLTFGNLKSKLNEYLNNINREIEYKEKIIKTLKNPNDYYKILILNFNYTDTIQRYFSDKNISTKNIKIINFHGDLTNNNYNPMIFGFGYFSNTNFEKIKEYRSKNALKYLKTLEYKRSFNYTKLHNWLIDQEIEDSAIQMNDEFKNSKGYYDVLILGHSCSITDGEVLKKVINSEKCVSLNILHNSEKKNALNDYMEKQYQLFYLFDNVDDFRLKIKPFDERDTFD